MEDVIRLGKQELTKDPLPYYIVYGLFFSGNKYKAEITYSDEAEFEYCFEFAEVYEVNENALSSHLVVPAEQIQQHVKSLNEVQFFRLMMFLKSSF